MIVGDGGPSMAHDDVQSLEEIRRKIAETTKELTDRWAALNESVRAYNEAFRGFDTRVLLVLDLMEADRPEDAHRVVAHLAALAQIYETSGASLQLVAFEATRKAELLLKLGRLYRAGASLAGGQREHGTSPN